MASDRENANSGCTGNPSAQWHYQDPEADSDCALNGLITMESIALSMSPSYTPIYEIAFTNELKVNLFRVAETSGSNK